MLIDCWLAREWQCLLHPKVPRCGSAYPEIRSLRQSLGCLGDILLDGAGGGRRVRNRRDQYLAIDKANAGSDHAGDEQRRIRQLTVTEPVIVCRGTMLMPSAG